MTRNIRLLTLTLTMAFALLIPSMASAQGFGAREDRTALDGTTLTYYPQPSIDRCQADCANNGNCRAFTWIQAGTYNPRDAAMCYLLSAVTRRAYAVGHTSALKVNGPVYGGTPIAWSKTARDFELRGKNGQRATFSCAPPTTATNNRLWGTDVYTDDSYICLAAVHAGLISFQRGGTVTIEIRPGQGSYGGSTRFGVASNAYGAYEGSFVFVR